MTNRVPFSLLADAPLTPGFVYDGGTAGTVADDPIQRLLPVGNAGGIRWNGPIEDPTMIVLYSTGQEAEWKDEVDLDGDGRIVYHGDNRTTGQELLKPPKHGNLLLHRFAERGFHPSVPIFVFSKSATPGPSRSVLFHGLAQVGAPEYVKSDWLTAKWFDGDGGRFLNYVLLAHLVAPAVIERDAISGLARR